MVGLWCRAILAQALAEDDHPRMPGDGQYVMATRNRGEFGDFRVWARREALQGVRVGLLTRTLPESPEYLTTGGWRHRDSKNQGLFSASQRLGVWSADLQSLP